MHGPPTAGLKLEPEKKMMRLGSVPLVIEQWWASQRVKASASANWNGISACSK